MTPSPGPTGVVRLSGESPTPADVRDAFADGLGPALIAIAEGAWIAAVYVLIELGAAGELAVPPLAFVGVAGVGIAVGAWTRTRPAYDGIIGVGLAATAVVGLAAASGVIGALAAGDPVRAFGVHPGGLLLGVAGVRGIVRGRSLADVDGSEAGLGGPTAVLVVAWLFAGALAEPNRTVAVTAITGPTLAFVVAAPAGTALNRVATIGRTTGFRWSANRVWLGLLSSALLVVTGIAVLAAADAGSSIRVLAPAVLVAIGVGAVLRLPPPAVRPEGRRRTVLGWLVIIAVLSIVLFLPQVTTPPRTTDTAAAATTTDASTAGRSGGTILVLAGLAVGVVLAAVAIRRRGLGRLTRAPEPEASRSPVPHLPLALGRAWRGRPRRRGQHAPTDAVGAYLAALAVLEADPTTRRGPDETPATHAARLRSDGTGGLALDLLAADYAIVRFADRRVSPIEDRRAVGRFSLVAAAADARGQMLRAERLARGSGDRDAVGRDALGHEGRGDGRADRADAQDAATEAREGRV